MIFKPFDTHSSARYLALSLLSGVLLSCSSPLPLKPSLKRESPPPHPHQTEALDQKPSIPTDIHLETQKLRGLSSVEVQNSVFDLFAISLAPIMADHPAEATDTGFFNSIYSYSVTSPRTVWYAAAAALVAQDLKESAPIFKDLPACMDGEALCLTDNLRKIAGSIYRRPPTEEEIAALSQSIIKSGVKTYFDSLKLAIEIMLQSSQFTFHTEAVQASGVLNGSFAVAARLAAVLWQSTPDSLLLEAAAKGGLLTESDVKAQIERMLSDSRSQRGLGQFVSEWLRLYTLSRRDLQEALAAGVTRPVLEGMILETQRTFTSAAMNPKANFMQEIFAPDTTYLTADLAKFYDLTLPEAKGAEPVAYALAADSPRRGILTQASFLFATTKRSSTSVITRGNSVYETILCKEAGAPGPDDLLEAAKDAAIIRSKRDESTHRLSKPKCGGCHIKIDPIGLALEPFDFVGRLRTVDEAKDSINPTTTFELDGKSIDFPNAIAMSASFAKSPTVSRCIAEKMIDYAFAGNLVDPEEITLNRVHKAFSDSNFSFQSLVAAIVLTPQFLEP